MPFSFLNALKYAGLPQHLHSPAILLSGIFMSYSQSMLNLKTTGALLLYDVRIFKPSSSRLHCGASSVPSTSTFLMIPWKFA